MQILGCLLLSVVLCLATGCESQAPPLTGQRPAAVSVEFAGRLQAALEIRSLNDRDAALGAIATDAAQAGSSQACQQAVQAISSREFKDSTAAECSALFAKAGNSTQAAAVAKLISWVELRDKTMARIATGE